MSKGRTINGDEPPAFKPAPAAPFSAWSARAMTAAPWALILLGAAFRLRQYLFNRALWLDEAKLALNLIDRSLAGLLQPLTAGQAAPVGFLMAQKASVLAFGAGELSLRLLPLFAGVISLVFFYAVAKLCLKPGTALAMLALFSSSEQLLYYSSEVKQYSTDVAVALGLTLITLHFQAGRLDARRAGLLALAGAAAVWFSHPAIFILAASGAFFFVSALLRKERAAARLTAAMTAFWLLSFCAACAVSLRSIEAMPPFPEAYPPVHGSDIVWIAASYYHFCANLSGGFTLAPYTGLLFAAGCLALAARSPGRLTLLVLPGILALAASVARLYPFTGRTYLFLAPGAMIVMGAALDLAAERLCRSRSCLRQMIVPAFLAAVLLVPVAVTAVRHFTIDPIEREEIRPAMAYLRDHRAQGDLIYVERRVWPAFTYYSSSFGFSKKDWIAGELFRDSAKAWRAQLETLRGHIVWVIFTKSDVDKTRVIESLKGMGSGQEYFSGYEASVWLYDLTRHSSGGNAHASVLTAPPTAKALGDKRKY